MTRRRARRVDLERSVIRLRYLLFAVIVLALVPWALDSLPSLSCVFPTLACLDESAETVADEDARRLASAPDAVLPNPIRMPPSDNAPPSPAAAIDTAALPVAVQVARTATAREVAPSAPRREFAFNVTRGFGGVVTIKWRMPDENGLDYYLLDRKLEMDNDDAFERQIATQAVDGSDEYSLTDTPVPDTYTYRLRGLAWTDQSDGGRILGTADVAVDYVVGLAVGNFALGAASGLVAVSWTTAREGGVVNYVLDRKLEGAASYDLNVEVGYPQGDGTAYELYDDPHGSGTFIYRLRATLSNGTERVLAEGGVTL